MAFMICRSGPAKAPCGPISRNILGWGLDLTMAVTAGEKSTVDSPFNRQ